MKKAIIITVTAILLTFSVNASAASNETTNSSLANTMYKSPVAQRWVKTLANGVKYTVTLMIFNNPAEQNYIHIVIDGVEQGDLPVSVDCYNANMYISPYGTKMELTYYSFGELITVGIEDLQN